MTFKEWKEVWELASYVTIVLGLPLALYQYRRKTLKEQQDREYGTYNALDEKYLAFVQLCFENPQLDIFDIPDATPVAHTPTDDKQELIAFTMLFSIFERAYLMYADQSSGIKRRQWSGWLAYLTEYCARENFRTAWRISGNTFDTHFQDFVEQTMLQAAPAAVPGATVRPVDTGNSAEVAAVVALATTSRVAGSNITGNELSLLLTSPDLPITTRALLAEMHDGTRGTLVTSAVENGAIELLTCVAITGRSTSTVWQALLRGAKDCFAAGTLLVEGRPGAESLLRQTVPGMGSFREALVPYRYLDGSTGQLWLWTTADAISRDELGTIIDRLVLGFYAPLRARSMAQTITAVHAEQLTTEVLAAASPMVPLRGLDLSLLPVASGESR